MKPEYRVPWCIPTKNTYLVIWEDQDGQYKTDFQCFHEALAFVRQHNEHLINWGIGWRKHNVWMIVKYLPLPIRDNLVTDKE
jgi:hypothetical protein